MRPRFLWMSAANVAKLSELSGKLAAFGLHR